MSPAHHKAPSRGLGHLAICFGSSRARRIALGDQSMTDRSISSYLKVLTRISRLYLLTPPMVSVKKDAADPSKCLLMR